MDNAIKDIWKTTWESWRNGELNEISNNYREEASVDFDSFIDKYKINSKYENISSIFSSDSARPNEYLIGFDASGKGPDFVMMILTNQRLWLYDKNIKNLFSLELHDIKNFKTDKHITSCSVDIIRRDGSRSVYKKIETIPSDRAISFALKTCVDSTTSKNNERNTFLIKDSNQADDNKIIKTEPGNSGLGLFAHIDKIIELGFAITFIYLIVKLIILKSR